MELMEGMVVCSKAGRDKGRFYLVIQLEGNSVWLADGKLHRLERPKRKNEKHLALTRTVLPVSQATSNKSLRKLLWPFQYGGQLSGVE